MEWNAYMSCCGNVVTRFFPLFRRVGGWVEGGNFGMSPVVQVRIDFLMSLFRHLNLLEKRRKIKRYTTCLSIEFQKLILTSIHFPWKGIFKLLGYLCGFSHVWDYRTAHLFSFLRGRGEDQLENLVCSRRV